MIRLEVLTEKFSCLKELDKDCVIFGAEIHEYKHNPVLSEEAVSAFERKHGIRLPEEYRLYITRTGDGGAGPFYGLLPLEDNEGNEVDPKSPFPFTADKPLNLWDMYNEIEDAENRDELFEKIYADTCLRSDMGVIYISHEGCGMYNVLVVNGEEYGKVWWIDLSNDAGVYPLFDPTTGDQLSFFRWYELWLDAAIGEKRGQNEELESCARFTEKP